MKINPLLNEIRQTRERLIAEAGMDVGRFFATMREHEAMAKARGELVIPAPKPFATVCEQITPYDAQPGQESTR